MSIFIQYHSDDVVPPDVALDLNIKPNPIPKIIPPKIAMQRIVF